YATLCTLHTSPLMPDHLGPDGTEPDPMEDWLFDPMNPNGVLDPEDSSVPEIKPPQQTEPPDSTQQPEEPSPTPDGDAEDGEDVPGWLG
ncbi:MAG: hypothetical protein ACI4QB_00365, partial [Eubacteriales bacterium]